MVVRLELFYLASFDIQCAAPGVECFLPFLLVLYEILPGRRPRIERRKDDDETFAQTAFEEFDDWAETSAPLSLVGALLLAYGAYRASTGRPTSTYFCSSFDVSSVFWAQQGGLLLDATIAILLWRILAWARTTKNRLRTLSGILLATSLAEVGMVWLLQQHEGLAGVGSLYVFDVVFDGFVFSLFAISAAFVVCDGRPSTLAGTIVLICGLVSATERILLAGTWENVRRGQSHTALFILGVGFATFSYTSGMRHILVIRRMVVLVLLVVFFASSALFILARGLLDYHAADKLVYNSRIEADRWLVRASLSKTLEVAVREYQARNHHRDPPPKFDVWYRYAIDRKSPVIDNFEQIGRDILPYWGLSPEKLREGVALAAKQPDIAIVKVEKGAASHSHFIDSPYRPILDELVGLMKPFSEHLPNMQIAVNLNERPRVLAPWDDVQRYTQAGMGHGRRKLLTRRSAGSSHANDLQRRVNSEPGILEKGQTSAHAFRQMTASTCPPGSSARSGVYYNVRDFCTTCASPQSEGLFLRDWHMSHDICHQPDLLRLHGFHITPPELEPLEQLVPIFSRSKTSSYSDIIIPLHRRYDIPEDEPGSEFQMKAAQLFWRGKIDGNAINHELLHGGHQARLVHLVNNSTASAKATILLPSPNWSEQRKVDENDRRDRYRYELAHVADLTSTIPINVAIASYPNCKDPLSPACALALREFGTAPEDPPALKNRYVLLTDSDDGPPRGFLPAVRSTSVPFVATIFREWHSERLMPWVHFVPVDIRYQGLFSSLSYFTGLQGTGEVNGRHPKLKARVEDAEWIAEQGRTWAGRALRREDMEVYLFRVLLEYGRLLDDKREDIGFVLT